MQSIFRLVNFIKNECDLDVNRFVGNIPAWLTDTCFAHACNKTTIRDAMEYARRFLRLRVSLLSGGSSSSCAAAAAADEPQPSFSRFEVKNLQRAVAIARLSFGSALEAAAALQASRICDVSQLPSDSPHSNRLAWLCQDGYMACLWTDAHVNYVLGVVPEGSILQDLTGHHIDYGAPCIRRTTSVSALPNMACKFERFCSNPQSVDDKSKNLVSVIFRCGQSGSRGWDSALKTSLDSAGSQTVLHSAFKVALVGTHPQLHPAARPDWSQRALILRVLDEHVTKDELNRVMISCGTCTKESIRLYMCSVMDCIPATRTALAKVSNSIGLLRSAPSELVQPSLAAAAQNIVAAGLAAATALSEARSTGGGGGLENGKAFEIVQKAISLHIGNEPRVRSRSSTHSRPISVEKNNKKTTDTRMVVIHDDDVMRNFFAVTYNPGWFGRIMPDRFAATAAGGGGDEPATAAAGAAGAAAALHSNTNSMNAMTVVHELISRAFRASFVPFWLHGNANGIRASRFDTSQHNYMISASSVNAVIQNMDGLDALRVQRIAMRVHTASTSTISQAGELLGLDEEDQNKLDEAKTFEEAMNAVCSLSPAAGSAMLLFGKVVHIKNRFLSYDLGENIKRRQLAALVRRFEIDPLLENPIDQLPSHATHLHVCLECRRIPNACVDDKSKMVSHNEIGLAQTMLRVGNADCPSEIRCARRSSAALRTAILKDSEAIKHRIECIPVDYESIQKSMRSNGDVSHAARLRRDLRTCGEQHANALACGDRQLVRVSLLGRVVRLNGRFYSLCSFCGSILQVNQMKRFKGDLCCCRCDSSMVGDDKTPMAQATRVAVEVDDSSKRAKPFVFSQIVASKRMCCRFCNKPPPTSSTATIFKILRTPNDGGGHNASLPPPLRIIALCTSHWRPWIESALNTMSMQSIFAHISSKCTPVFGADLGRKSTILAVRRPKQSRGSLKKQILVRANGIKKTNLKRRKMISI